MIVLDQSALEGFADGCLKKAGLRGVYTQAVDTVEPAGDIPFRSMRPANDRDGVQYTLGGA